MSHPEPPIENVDRRVSARIPVNERATILLGNMGSAVPCTLIDLCLGGCRVQTDTQIHLEPGVRAELLFHVAGAAFRIGGLAEWAASTREIGVLFLGLSARREAELVELLGELAAGWQEKQDDLKRAEEALKTAREGIQQRIVELEVKSAREAALRAEVEQVAQEKREAEERLKLARKELMEAEKAAQQFARLTMSEPGKNTVPSDASAKHGRAPEQRMAESAAVKAPSHVLSGRERRQAQRHAVDSTAMVFLVDVRSNMRGRIVDVSVSGCRIRFDERFPVGIYRRVEIEFLLDGLPFRLPGVVQSLHDHFTAGIRFIDLSDRKREQLQFVIEEITEMAEAAGSAPQAAAN